MEFGIFARLLVSSHERDRVPMAEHERIMANVDGAVVIESMEPFGKEVLPQFDKDPVHRTTHMREASSS